MGRRTILLVVAALVAVLGSGLVFVYVKGADARAMQGQAPVEVLKAVARIEPGETLEQAQAAGKLELRSVPAEQVLEGALSTVGELGDGAQRSEEHTSELQSRQYLVCRLLLEKKNY